MGRPKAILPFDGVPLITYIVRNLESLFAQLIVVAAPEQKIPATGVHLVCDDVPYQGPVGGICYGMRACKHPICFVTSCDAPFLSVSLISYLLSQISDYDVVVPVWEDRLQPLHAVYRSSVLPALEEQLARNELRPIFLYDRVRTRKISEEVIRRIDPEGLSFLNMNTPEDYEKAEQRWREIRRRESAETDAAMSAGSATSSISCTVELFGGARLRAKIAEVNLTLARGATLSDLLSALADRLPVLVGPVITPDAKGLSRGYACNVNGRDFVRDASFEIHAGDSVFIISADAGG